jgi:hypothetical protein
MDSPRSQPSSLPSSKPESVTTSPVITRSTTTTGRTTQQEDEVLKLIEHKQRSECAIKIQKIWKVTCSFLVGD